MINKDNLPNLLIDLGFHKQGSAYSKTFGTAKLEINISKREISSPEAQGMLVNERQPLRN